MTQIRVVTTSIGAPYSLVMARGNKINVSDTNNYLSVL